MLCVIRKSRHEFSTLVKEAASRKLSEDKASLLTSTTQASQQKRQKRDIQRKARSQHALQKKLQNQKQEEQAEADRESGDFGTMRNTKSKSLLGSSMPSTKEFKADHNESGTSRDSSQYDTDTDDGDDHDDDILLSAELKQLDRSNNTDDKAVRNKKIPESCKNRSRKLTVTHLREGYSSASIPGLNRNVVFVKRKPEINETRSKLPVVHQEQEIMEAINSHNVIVICGPTGSGKTTQLPQFVYEAGYNQGCVLLHNHLVFCAFTSNNSMLSSHNKTYTRSYKIVFHCKNNMFLTFASQYACQKVKLFFPF